MATTILQGFNLFRSNLEITNLQQTTVSGRQATVRSVLASGLDLKDSFLAGSYSRHTLIAPLKEADIDVFVVLDPKYYYNYNNQNGGQAGLLDLVKRVLRKSYPRTPDISRSGQAVTIRFDDFMVDVVPAFVRDGGGYLIPNSMSQTWINTDPKAHVTLVGNSNSIHNGDLVPTIKMIKAWNRSINYQFRSFHLEVLALAIFEGVRISDFSSGVRFFFDKGRHLVTQKNPDPALQVGDVGYYINSQQKVEEAASRFRTAYERAVRAEDAVRAGKISEAISIWQQIFGNYFPSYG
jgi:Second Messenger Oligonucleotide or Dinucleotide Synthetase domain